MDAHVSCSAAMTDAWDDLAGWWIDAVRDDPSQSTDTHDVLAELLGRNRWSDRWRSAAARVRDARASADR